MATKIPLNTISTLFSEGIGLFIGMASFEQRSASIISSLKDKPSQCFLFKNKIASDMANLNLQKMTEYAGDDYRIIDLDLDSPLSAADAFFGAINKSSIKDIAGDILIDSTTFTHEQLLILLRIIEMVKPTQNIIFAYTGAAAYSFNTNDESVWLSRGVSQIRSVLGYPGKLVPSKHLHLILLVGFEHERAAAVIEQFEPAKLTIGVGGIHESVSATHHATNTRFFNELKDFIERKKMTLDTVDTFTFSCVDPIVTRDAVLKEVSREPGFNVVVCPMNTKLSTIGTGLAALIDERIQLAYARAIEYNEFGYSLPSEDVTIYEVNFL